MRLSPNATKSNDVDRGGGERVRTDDLLRARQALSQLSYTPRRLMRIWIADPGFAVALKSKIKNQKPEIAWWAWMELNHRPHAYQACALTKLSYRPIEIRNLRIRISECRHNYPPRLKTGGYNS